ncbi:MAG: hypothetical protein QM763_00600 [Agriterribacter sp.]
MDKISRLQKLIKVWSIFFIISLVLSGITAFAVETGLAWVITWWPKGSGILHQWLYKSYEAVHVTNTNYPFIAYGYDWLAFGHIIIAIFFIGVLKDPVRNIWVIKTGCIACILVIPLALIAGHIRQIPIFWRLIDCSFGVTGIIPLFIVYRNALLLEKIQLNNK